MQFDLLPHTMFSLTILLVVILKIQINDLRFIIIKLINRNSRITFNIKVHYNIQ